MAKERGQDGEWVEVGDAFDRLAIAEHKPVHVRPFHDLLPDTGMKPELDEHQVAISTPAVDVSAEVGKAAPDASELCLCRLDPDHPTSERLHEKHIGMQEFR